MVKFEKVAFIGLGVMGEPMCRNLIEKSGLPIVGLDPEAGPLERLTSYGVIPAQNLSEALTNVDAVMISLPSGVEFEKLSSMEEGLLSLSHAGQTIIDLGTTPVELTRRLATSFATKGAWPS